MNKTILKILICTLILLIGIGAVSAIEHNSTDELLSVEQTNEVSVIEDNTEVISVNESNTEVLSSENNNTAISVCENNTEVISITENGTEVLSAEDNNTVISVNENATEVLSAENNNIVISVSNDKDLTGYSPFATEPQMTQSETQYKTFYLGQVKFLKKYKKMFLYGYNKPSKKNKKAWKKHRSYLKALKKQRKKIEKRVPKLKSKLNAQHWHPYGDLKYNLEYRGNYMYVRFYGDCYRTHYYNPLLNEEWWE